MTDTLVNRLRGLYGIGPNNDFGIRSFADFIPPISLEAASRIEELERVLGEVYDQVYDNPSIDKLVADTLSDDA